MIDDETMAKVEPIGTTLIAEPQANGQERPPTAGELLGHHLALFVAAAARSLPGELSPQSRYQVAIDLAKTVVGSELGRVFMQ